MSDTEVKPLPSVQNSNLPIFRATRADRDAVLTIDSGYDELDYLPDLYEELIEGPGVRGFVLRKSHEDETVIGFLSTLLVDGGQVVATKAGRIHPDYRGSGLYGKFTRDVFIGHLGVRNTTMVVNAVNAAKFTDKFFSKYDTTHSQATMSYRIDMSEVLADKTSEQVVSPEGWGLHAVTLPDLEIFLKQAPKAVFPDGRFMIQFYPFRVMPENAQTLISGSSRRKLYTSGVEFSQDGKSANFKDEESIAISSGAYYTSPNGVLTYHLDLYGSEASEKCLENHVRWHVHHLADLNVSQIGKPNVILHVFYQQDVEQFMESLKNEFVFKLAAMEEIRKYSPMIILDRMYD